MAGTLAPETTYLSRPSPYLGKMCAEGIGTFILVFAGCGAVMVDAHTGGALGHLGICAVFGLAVAAVVYTIGHVSGAHINPAVTVALAATGHFSWRETPGYIAAQCLGAIAAAVTLSALLGPLALVGTTQVAGSALSGLVVEALITAVLMYIIMGVATDSRSVPGAAGAVVGGTVMLLAMVAGPLTGASMNPARSLGPALAAGHLDQLLIYWSAPFVGAVLGAMLYELTAAQK